MVSVQAQPVANQRQAPIRAEDNLPKEVTLELRKGNLVRAAHLAIEKAVLRDKVRELQLDAIRQFIEQLHNFEGAKELVSGTGVNTSGTMFPDFRSFFIQQDMNNGLTEEQAGRVVLRFLCESAGCSFRPALRERCL